MHRLTLSDMGVDLTNELAGLLLLSVHNNEHYFIGKRFIDRFADAVISSDVKLISELSGVFLSYLPENSSHKNCEKRFSLVFYGILKKIHPVNSIDTLIRYLDAEKYYHGWGDIVIKELQGYKKKGIEYINLSAHPYRYAEEGIMPYVELWLSKELKKKQLPFYLG